MFYRRLLFKELSDYNGLYCLKKVIKLNAEVIYPLFIKRTSLHKSTIDYLSISQISQR